MTTATLFGDLMSTTASNAPWPVWSDSQRGRVKFAPLSKREAVKIWHHARRFENKTRAHGGQGAARCYNGKISRVGLMVLQALLFDFLNYASGRLDPSYQAIAEKAGVSLRSVGRALVRLKTAGVLNWIRRCSDSMIDGRFVLEQETNAYGVAPPSQWRGYAPAQEAPRPHPDTWGARPALPAFAVEAGDSQNRILQSLEGNPDPAAQSLARLGRAILSRPGR